MHDSSRTDVPRLLTMVEEQCKILRSDLFAVTSKEVKDSWVKLNILKLKIAIDTVYLKGHKTQKISCSSLKVCSIKKKKK